jgi:hypothetical protein
MAVDETLLDSAAEGICTVRWYRWEQATLSLGYFQSQEEALADSRLRDLPIVRRLSGGGAIVHHHELTYSCAVPALHPLAAAPRRLYSAVHEGIIGVLAEFGYEAALRGTNAPALGAEYLCFGRMDDFDVVMGGHKVLGSAQRRRKGAVLQHGRQPDARAVRMGARISRGVRLRRPHCSAAAPRRATLSRSLGIVWSTRRIVRHFRDGAPGGSRAGSTQFGSALPGNSRFAETESGFCLTT